MAAVAIIPARLDSSRLPGKLLLRDTGRTVLQHTYERCRAAHRLSRVLIATDSEQIRQAAEGFGAEVVMTSPDHLTGSDRVAEVARELDDELVLNVQGDEPQIAPEDLDRLVEELETASSFAVATLALPLHEAAAFRDPNTVKIVCDAARRALYFSRAPIPSPPASGEVPDGALKHKGIYAYRRQALLELAAIPPVHLEEVERLEQLRALFHGYPILVVLTQNDGIEINTPSDYQRFCKGVSS